MLALKNNIIFVHVPKTGGRFIRKSLRQLDLIDGKYAGLHSGLDELNPVHNDYRKVAGVRNPWDWYVSLYFFQKNLMCQKTFSKNKIIDTSSFPDYMRLMFSDSSEIRGRFLWPRKNHKNTDAGALTNNIYKQCYLNDVDCIDYYIRLEHIKEDFQIAFNLTDEDADEIDFFKKDGRSNHMPYQDYYNQELIDLVAIKEKEIINRFKYDF